jgi:hypothetical protein
MREDKQELTSHTYREPEVQKGAYAISFSTKDRLGGTHTFHSRLSAPCRRLLMAGAQVTRVSSSMVNIDTTCFPMRTVTGLLGYLVLGWLFSFFALKTLASS